VLKFRVNGRSIYKRYTSVRFSGWVLFTADYREGQIEGQSAFIFTRRLPSLLKATQRNRWAIDSTSSLLSIE